MKKSSIKTKILLSILGTTFIASCFLSLVLILMARSDFKLVGEHYLLGLEQSSIAYFDNTIASTVDNLAKSLVNPVYYDDFNFIQKQLTVVEDQVIVDSVTLLDTGASILHEGSKDFPRLGTEVNIPPEDMESLRQGNLVMNIRDGQRTAMQGIFLGDELLGILSITSQP
ncbi:MAG: hypothetical protein RLN96_02715, partial [Pseudomonadales bacterium]